MIIQMVTISYFDINFPSKGSHYINITTIKMATIFQAHCMVR